MSNQTVTLRGGVYKNNAYCQDALIGSSIDKLNSGSDGQEFKTDSNGILTVYMDSTQFWSKDQNDTSQTKLTSKDNLKYVFEVSEIASDTYYPLFVTINGNLGMKDVIRNGKGNVLLQEVPKDGKYKPFIASQSVDYGLSSQQEVDVKDNTGRIGPNSTYTNVKLRTIMLLWGENTNSSKGYTFKLVDENGFEPKEQDTNVNAYPFSSIPVAEDLLTLSEDNMTKSGWIPNGEDRGMKTILKYEDDLVQESVLPFRLIDLTRVPKVTEDDRVTQIVLDMKNGSGIETSASFGETEGMDNIISALTGKLDKMSGPIDGSMFKMIISPSKDNTVFKAMIWAGYNSLDVGDMDYSNDGVALSADILSQSLDVGVPGLGDISDMANGSYSPKQTAKDNRDSGVFKDADIGAQLEGYYEAEIRYNPNEDKWNIYTLGGGFTAGVGGSLSFNVNAVAGPVPLTASFTLGGSLQLDFKSKSRYSQIAGYEWSNASEKVVNDYLTTLRLNAYVNAFSGFGFDYSIVALKIGIFGGLSVDSQNKFLSRTYLKDKTKRQINGQALGISGEIGIKFVARLLVLEYEAVLVSGGISATKTFNNWKAIDEYWDNTDSGISSKSLKEAADAGNMELAKSSSLLQSREYLEAYSRTWNEDAAVESDTLSTFMNPSVIFQTNANPSSYPVISEDGEWVAYITDGDSNSIYDSRAGIIKNDNGDYGLSDTFPNLGDFTGYGDSGISIAGNKDNTTAAWVRMGECLTNKNAGDEISPAEQNLLMNSAEIVVSTYNGTKWESKRLTDNAIPDMSPVVATSGNNSVVFWRSVYAGTPGENGDDLLNFTTKDCIQYSIYNGVDWSTPKMLYNGTSGAVKALQADILSDGTAIAAFSLDRGKKNDSSEYEIAYTVIKNNGDIGETMFATNNDCLDENPQVKAVSFNHGKDERFVIGWHMLDNNESDIRLLAVDSDGVMSNLFPESLKQITSNDDVNVGGNFKFASMDNTMNTINDLSIMWSEEVANESTGITDHSILKGVKFCSETESIEDVNLSSPLVMLELEKNNTIDHFSSYISNKNQIKSIMQITEYKETGAVINGIMVPDEEIKLLFDSSEFQESKLEVTRMGVDYSAIYCNRYTPIQFDLHNTGINKLTDVTIELADGEKSVLKGSLLPNESASVTVWHKIGDSVTDVNYSITCNEKILKSGTVYLDYPDIGISRMETIEENKGKRVVRMTLYNSASAKLSGNKERNVKLALYTDSNYSDGANVSCTMDGVSVKNNIITISNEANLELIDKGIFTLELTYDLGNYVKNTLNEKEIPDEGIYLYANSWIEGKIGDKSNVEELPEYNKSDNKSVLLFTGAIARTGQNVDLKVEQETVNSVTQANISLKNNSLQTIKASTLTALLLDNDGKMIEAKQSKISGDLNGEDTQTDSIKFSKPGNRVIVKVLEEDKDSLLFEGLPIGISDFKGDNGKYICSLDNVTMTSTQITAITGNGSNINIDGEEYDEGYVSEKMNIAPGKSEISVIMNNNTYILKLSNDRKVEYSLEVVNGTGSGTYTEGTSVPVSADLPIAGKEFKEWIISSGKGELVNSKNEKTEFVLSDSSAVIEATYKDIPKSLETPTPMPTLTPTPTLTPAPTSTPASTLTPAPTLKPTDIPADVSKKPQETFAPNTMAPSATPTSSVNQIEDEDITRLNIISSSNSESDAKNSKFSKLKLSIVKSTKSMNRLKWDKIRGIDGYILYGNKCGKKNPMKYIAAISKNTTSFKHENLTKGTYYKYYLVAYKTVDGKKLAKEISKTIHVPTLGGKFTDVGSVIVNKKKLT